MTAEGVYQKGGAKVRYLHQTNFFDIVSKPDFEVKTPPTRTLSTFWNSDVLPTAMEIRRFYIKSYKESDNEILEYVWDWMKNDKRNEELVQIASGNEVEAFGKLPTEVALNLQTAFFFAMRNDFKKNPKTDLFEPFVAWQPGTSNWRNDVGRTTFDFSTSFGQRPLEIHQSKKDVSPGPNRRILLRRVDDNEKLVDRYEGIDSITWTVLMKYHMELWRRENWLLGQLKTTTI